MSIVAVIAGGVALSQGGLVVGRAVAGDPLAAIAAHAVQGVAYLTLAGALWLAPRSDRFWVDDAWTRGRRLAIPTVAVVFGMYVVLYALDPGPIVLGFGVVFGALLLGLVGWTAIDRVRVA
ncbi:hypothetical protein [Halococcoides cellulosivorans]|nr:hypothetical protein [Halococcoides cellulosivorans]